MSTVRIAHLSDPHFGTVLEPVRHALLHRLRELNVDLCLISGDITQRAKRGQFLAARAFKRDLLPLPSFAIPGNHDIPLFNLPFRLLDPYGGFHRHFQMADETSVTIGRVHVVGLNSTSRWRHVQGRLNLDRIHKAVTVAPAATQVRIVAVHHPLDCAQHVDEKNLIVGRDDVVDLFATAKVDLVLSGHIHDPFVTLSNRRYPTAKRPMILSVAGTCLSWRTREGAPNSFTCIEIEDGEEPKITLRRQDFDPDGQFRERKDCIDEFVRPRGTVWTRA